MSKLLISGLVATVCGAIAVGSSLYQVRNFPEHSSKFREEKRSAFLENRLIDEKITQDYDKSKLKLSYYGTIGTLGGAAFMGGVLLIAFRRHYNPGRLGDERKIEEHGPREIGYKHDVYTVKDANRRYRYS